MKPDILVALGKYNIKLTVILVKNLNQYTCILICFCINNERRHSMYLETFSSKYYNHQWVNKYNY